MTKETKKLERLRKDASLTIAAFCRRLPIQRSTYYGWLSGKRKPDPFRMRECLMIAEML